MTILDADIYLKPISEAEPCGEALDYDLSFLELEMAARGKPGQELGASVIAAEPPNWVEVDRLAGELSTQSKDLRIAVLAARAALHLEGLPGFGRGLEALAVYAETFWPGLHPRPDEEDGDDQTVRINVLANLCDPEGLLGDLRRTPLTQSRVFGNFSVRDWLEAQRLAAAGDDTSTGPDVGTIEGAFRDTPAETLDQRGTAIAAIIAAVTRIDAAIRAKVDTMQAMRFDPLLEILRQMQTVVEEHKPVPVDEAAPGAEAVAKPISLSNDIRDRNDIVGMLDRICRWYRANEPSSPVPPLLERAKRLVAKDFMALLLELAPEGAAQFRALAGLTADGEQRTP
jgi:type VI secretion system protein ImpA